MVTRQVPPVGWDQHLEAPLSRVERSPARVLVRLLTAVAVVIAAVALPVLPAHADRITKTLAHNVAVGEAPMRPGFAIEYLGVVWEGEHGPAWARFLAGGRWGDWIELDEDGAQAEGQYGTQLLHADRATAFQVQVPDHARNARVVALNVHDGERVVVDRTTPAAAAGAGVPVVSRAGWGADESLRFKDGNEIWPPAYYDAQKLTVHHTATKNDDADPVGTVQAIYRYHAVDRGWGDIGYQYLVDEAGTVYEGRWSGTDGDVAHDADGRLVTAAHVGGYNSGNAGISLLGDFRRVKPKAPAQASLENVLAELAGRHGIDPLASGTYVNPVNGTTKDVANISAHMDWESTACPGTKLYDLLPTIRETVAAKMASSGTAPAAPADLAASAIDSSSIALTWSDVSSDETSFEVARGGIVVASLASDTTAWTDTGLATATTYEYQVRAVNSAGPSAWSNTASATTAAAPAVESIALSAAGTKVRGLQKADLSWTGADAVDVYWRDGAATDFTLLATVSGSSWRHDIDRKGAGTYTYEVRSGDIRSNQATVTF